MRRKEGREEGRRRLEGKRKKSVREKKAADVKNGGKGEEDKLETGRREMASLKRDVCSGNEDCK